MKCPNHFEHGEVDGKRGGHGTHGWELCHWRGCAEPGCPAERQSSGHFCADHDPVVPTQPVIDGPQS